MKYKGWWALLCVGASNGCGHDQQLKSTAKIDLAADSCRINFDYDTLRFGEKTLTDCQRKQLFYHRNSEEDYEKLSDTTRVAIRFSWWRAFHGLTIVRLENRPTIQLPDSSNPKIREWNEWFALYKIDISDLNKDFTVVENGKYKGAILPFVHEQHVEILPANKTPRVLQAIDSIGFWTMQPKYLAPAHTDGSSWMLEVYKNGRYHTVQTTLPEHPIKLICRQLLKLSKHPARKDEIY